MLNKSVRSAIAAYYAALADKSIGHIERLQRAQDAAKALLAVSKDAYELLDTAEDAEGLETALEERLSLEKSHKIVGELMEAVKASRRVQTAVKELAELGMTEIVLIRLETDEDGVKWSISPVFKSPGDKRTGIRDSRESLTMFLMDPQGSIKEYEDGQAILNEFGIERGGDSSRRKLWYAVRKGGPLEGFRFVDRNGAIITEDPILCNDKNRERFGPYQYAGDDPIPA